MERDERIAKLLNALNNRYLNILNEAVGYPITRPLVDYMMDNINHCNSRMTRTGWKDFCWESQVVVLDNMYKIAIDLFLSDIDWKTSICIDFDLETSRIEIKNVG